MAPLAAAMQTALEKIEILPGVREYRHPEPVARCARTCAADPSIIVVGRRTSPTSGALDRAPGRQCPLSRCWAGRFSPLDGHRSCGPDDRCAHLPRARCGGDGDHPRAQCDRRRGRPRAQLHHRPPARGECEGDAPCARPCRVGGELDYLDEGTLTAAIRQRTTFLNSGRAEPVEMFRAVARRPAARSSGLPTAAQMTKKPAPSRRVRYKAGSQREDGASERGERPSAVHTAWAVCSGFPHSAEEIGDENHRANGAGESSRP